MQTTTSSPPSRRTASKTGQYLYAIIDYPRDGEYALAGIDGARVYAIGDGQTGAIVSEVPNVKIRPERRRLAAHHEVLKQLRRDHTVLPMAFGLIADSAEAVHKILTLNREKFVEQIQRVAGRMEMGLHVFWDVSNIFEYFLAKHTELRDLRDQFFRGGRQPSQDELIEVGRTFDRLRNEQRAADIQTVMEVLGRRCFEIKENNLRQEREVINLACLIGQEAQKEFEEAVLEVAQRFDNNYLFDFNGPWPPYNFVEVSLEM